MNRATFTFIIPCLIFAFSSLQAQSSIDEHFDQTIGKENLPLNNGVFYYNPYKTNNTNQYYHTNKYLVGNIIYENQFYNNSVVCYTNVSYFLEERAFRCGTISSNPTTRLILINRLR